MPPIEFAQAGAHPEQAALVKAVLAALAERWPGALRAVVLYDPDDPDDHSMGHADPGVIRLSRFWLAQPLESFNAAAGRGEEVSRDGVAPWHGAMPEPLHLLAHEFGHLLQIHLGPSADALAALLYREAIAGPQMAATGYSLVSPDELFAEAFASLVIGNSGQQQVAALGRFLAREPGAADARPTVRERFALAAGHDAEAVFREEDHPRAPAGEPIGGEFVPKGSGGGAGTVRAPGRLEKSRALARRFDPAKPPPKMLALSAIPLLDAGQTHKPRSRPAPAVEQELNARGQAALKALGVESGKIEGPDPQTDELLARTIAAEVAHAIGGDNNARNWYTASIDEAMGWATRLHPELATNKRL